MVRINETELPMIEDGKELTPKQAIKLARKWWLASARNGEKDWVGRVFDEGVSLGRAEALGLKCVDGDPIKVIEKEG